VHVLSIVLVAYIRQDLYNQPISKLVEFIVASYDENPGIALEVFVHKAEKLQEDDKIGLASVSSVTALLTPHCRKLSTNS